jgi:aryl-alcohol dehydrogenase-like predicted oxidoreductase
MSKAVVDWSVKTATASLEQTLRTLGRDRLDILFLHEPRPELLDAEEFHNWLARQRDAGKIRYWGLAGPLEGFAQWVNHPLGQILQVRDLLSAPDILKLTLAGRKPQFTYGVIPSASDKTSVQQAIREALARNAYGSVLVSTQRISHLRELALATL